MKGIPKKTVLPNILVIIVRYTVSFLILNIIDMNIIIIMKIKIGNIPIITNFIVSKVKSVRAIFINRSAGMAK